MRIQVIAPDLGLLRRAMAILRDALPDPQTRRPHKLRAQHFNLQPRAAALLDRGSWPPMHASIDYWRSEVPIRGPARVERRSHPVPAGTPLTCQTAACTSAYRHCQGCSLCCGARPRAQR